MDIESVGHVVRLDRWQIETCSMLANSSMARFAANPNASYPNKWWSHLKGHLGEAAVAQWGKECGFPVDHWYKDESKYGLADVGLVGVPIEVKTWSRPFWKQFGRCVAVSQWQRVRQKALAIVWCMCLGPDELTTELLAEIDDIEVQLMGWNVERDFIDSRLVVSRNIENYQMPENKVREMSDLYVRLQARKDRTSHA